MKHIISLVTLFLIIQCVSKPKAQSYNIYNNPIKDSIMFEKFDFELDKTDYINYERVGNSRKIYGSNLFYQLKNGGVFQPNNGKNDIFNIVIPPSPAFYTIWYTYFHSGNIEKKGKIAGFLSGIRIGVWKYYSENGTLLKEVDEDKKFGVWTFDKVLEQMNKDQAIDIATGKNREYAKLQFFFNNDKKEWKVKVFKKDKDQFVEEYWEYIFDGNTGKHSREWYEEYNEETQLMIGEGVTMPPLKNSKKNKQKRVTEVYRTHEGKSYTQSEWEAHEEKEYEAYCKRTGRPYTPKDLRTSTEQESSKSPFMAQDGETGDDNTPKKKGFWDNLFG